MTAGFIQGNATEVILADILPDDMKSASNRKRKEAFARAYENQHPGVTVICDWETISDEVIAQLTPKEQEQALVDREALARRKERRKIAAAEHKPPTLDGDPERMARELKRQRAMLASLTLDHQQYERIWQNAVDLIHELEDICGIERTQYVKGERITKEDDPVSPQLQTKLNKYLALPRKKREASIIAGENAELIKLFRDNEPDPALQDLIITRLVQLEAL